MGEKILGYVRLAESGEVYPFTEQEENGYLVEMGDYTGWIDKKGCVETEIDSINPQHYKNGIETIDYMQAVMSKSQFEGYLRGSVIKYISRYDKKNGVEDLKKANWYQDRLIKLLEVE